MFSIEQGDILKVENIKGHVLVVSKKILTDPNRHFCAQSLRQLLPIRCILK